MGNQEVERRKREKRERETRVTKKDAEGETDFKGFLVHAQTDWDVAVQSSPVHRKKRNPLEEKLQPAGRLQ